MEVDSEVVNIAAGATITFTNSFAPPADASVQFFESAADKNADNPLSGFCTSMTGTSLTVPGTNAGEGNNKADCTVSSSYSGDFFPYTVSAPTPYVDLDPVIIIDEPSFSPLLFIGPIVFAALGLGIGFTVGYRRGKRAH
jgi:hypothetical protein